MLLLPALSRSLGRSVVAQGYVSDEPRFDEPGYVAIPSCMWGRKEDGLAPPPLMNGVAIHVVSVTNSTYGHHGEMALPQAMVARGPLKM